MTHSPLFDMACGFAIVGGLIFCAVEANANDTHLDHHYEEQMKALGKVVFPPHFDGSYQSLHANGATVTSNVPRRGERKCRQQVGIDNGRAVIFQHCGRNGEAE